MKKLLLLLCGVMLCLCACQAEQAQEPAPEKRLPPDRELTMEEALEYVTPLYSYELMNEIVEDMDAAKEAYEGYYYLMNLIVEINAPDRDYLLGSAENPNYTVKSGIHYVVYLPKEERAGMEYGDIVQVVGKIPFIGSSNVLKRRADIVEVTDAHLVTKSIEITGEIVMIESNYNEERFCSLIDQNVLSKGLGEIAVFLPDGFDCKAGDTFTATGKMHGGDGHVFFARPAKSEYLLWMEVPERIEIIDS